MLNIITTGNSRLRRIVVSMSPTPQRSFDKHWLNECQRTKEQTKCIRTVTKREPSTSVGGFNSVSPIGSGRCVYTNIYPNKRAFTKLSAGRISKITRNLYTPHQLYIDTLNTRFLLWGMWFSSAAERVGAQQQQQQQHTPARTPLSTFRPVACPREERDIII